VYTLRCLTLSALIASLSPQFTKPPSSNTADAASKAVENFIALETGSPASVHWDDVAQVLYIGDNDAIQIWRWTDAKGLEKFGTTTDPGGEVDAMATLVGQSVHLADGTVAVARFGKPGGGLVAWRG
jgi:hypothetical protein